MFKIKVIYEDGYKQVFYFKTLYAIHFNNQLLTVYEEKWLGNCIFNVEKFTVKQLKGKLKEND